MENPYTEKDFVHEVWEEFPQLAEWHDLDNEVLPIWKLEQLFNEQSLSIFHLKRPLRGFVLNRNLTQLLLYIKVW